MSFGFKRHESVPKGTRRIIRKELAKVLNRLNESTSERSEQEEIVHDARRGMKKVRAVLRAARFGLCHKEYRSLNRAFRNIARPLTKVRDAKVVNDAFEKLGRNHAFEPGITQSIRRQLAVWQQTIDRTVLEDEHAFQSTRASLRTVRNDLRHCEIEQGGWSVVGRGVDHVYTAGFQCLQAALSEPTVEHLHEWRKQAKYYYYQLQLLEPIAPRSLKRVIETLHLLTEYLGDDHDLVVLTQTLNQLSDVTGESREAFEHAIRQQRQELQRKAFAAGETVYQDRPDVVLQRLKNWWRRWRNHRQIAEQTT